MMLKVILKPIKDMITFHKESSTCKVPVNKDLLTGAVSVNTDLLTGNKELLTERVPVNNLFLLNMIN